MVAGQNFGKNLQNFGCWTKECTNVNFDSGCFFGAGLKY